MLHHLWSIKNKRIEKLGIHHFHVFNLLLLISVMLWDFGKTSFPALQPVRNGSEKSCWEVWTHKIGAESGAASAVSLCHAVSPMMPIKTQSAVNFLLAASCTVCHCQCKFVPIFKSCSVHFSPRCLSLSVNPFPSSIRRILFITQSS